MKPFFASLRARVPDSIKRFAVITARVLALLRRPERTNVGNVDQHVDGADGLYKRRDAVGVVNVKR
jgi:hypothetical protein